MAPTKLTASYDDLSTERGFQLRFRCDVCGRGYVTRLQTYTAPLVANLLHMSGGLFGAILGHSGESSHGFHHAFHHDHHGAQSRDEAFAMAVAEARAHFAHCTGCGNWVCSKQCWNSAAGLCKDCAQKRK